MKTITLWQPWASLVILDIKHNETRSWATTYHGELAIHAGKKVVSKGAPLFDGLPYSLKESIYDAIDSAYGCYDNLPTGCILGVVNLKGSIPTEKIGHISKIEMACGDFSPGRFAWPLDIIKRFIQPIPAIGHQGLWNWDENALKEAKAK
jgi:hypothetical protein